MDELDLLEQKRQKKLMGHSENKKNNFPVFSRKFVLKSMCGLAVVGGLFLGGQYGAAYCNEQKEIASQNKIRAAIRGLSYDTLSSIYRKYDAELLMLIEEYQSGRKLNGIKWSPANAVFAAQSDLLYKYDAYNPKASDEKRTLEEWALLDHISYRFYQFRCMKLSKQNGYEVNPYSDMLRLEMAVPSTERSVVKFDNFFDGLKMKNVVKSR